MATAGRESARVSAVAVPFVPLGTSGLSVSAIGFGAWAIGGDGYQFGWGAQDDDDSAGAIRRALELGVDWIDTAAVYGIERWERVIGRTRDGLANRPLLFTKGGRLEGADPASSGACGETRCAASWREPRAARRRRRRPLSADPDPDPDPDAEIEEGWAALADFKAEGLVRHIGVSNFSVSQMRRNPADRAHRDAATALLARRTRGRSRDSSLRARAWDRRDRLRAHGVRPAQRAR